MYVPGHFAPDDDAVDQLLSQQRAADLVTAGENGLEATMLPFVYDPERATLQGHFARNNEHWRHVDGREALVIVRGPDFYVTPGWYASKAEHGRVVPTWNYVVAHVHGTATIHDDTVWLGDLVRRLTDHHEARRPAPWSVDDAPETFIAGQLRAIVGVEVAITRIDAKFKLSQNRPGADVDGVIDGLRADGDTTSAAAVEVHRPTRC
ncbi:transcriptional regulator [Mycobacterium antarcticum]|uniref:FMN-binding negative transcriptional regulator n=1 Tax=unclassified Mycolicibacterium TaxID=2636767 RepID=UPI00238B6390|nr:MULTISPECIES: FMN-binding negative transcriptional regulator [unclassified Mycolicibacterium]BDX31492.1 transcriptional regulator [Mycolicibacterium sp. TUM20985]GLP74839.1 transcriptional regulator [Mycolicibacterium sp. TUM20983]